MPQKQNIFNRGFLPDDFRRGGGGEDGGNKPIKQDFFNPNLLRGKYGKNMQNGIQ